jgi:arylsulfatase A-like enzyme
MKRPDIVFLVLDTQRADRLGCYGYGTGQTAQEIRNGANTLTPNIDRWAAQATLFEQAIAPAQWTVPSHASMFTGLYPTAHQVTQSNQALGPDRAHLAELLREAGYQTVGFCNNPLVGILNNGFKRGFQTFYNYGGAVPTLPRSSMRWLPWPWNRLAESYTQFLRRISYPIQNFFGQSDLAFSLSLNAWLTPLWSRLANFKGQNERSIGDVVRFLEEREVSRDRRPLFLFINLMETHLPFWPPGEFIDRVAPYMRQSREARATISRWNREAYRWQAPLAEPLSELESRVLNDMYDAEVAYQDHYLGRLFEALNGRARSGNTLTLVVADHGDSLGEHNYMGHAFVAYQELLHVPLLLSWPSRLPRGRRISNPVSTRRVYHTLLEAVGNCLPQEMRGLNEAEIQGLTLMETINGRDPEQSSAFSEVYPPLNFVKAIEQRQPELVQPFRCLALRRALVKENLKLIQVDGRPDELFDLGRDPLELSSVKAQVPATLVELNQQLERTIGHVERQRDNLAAGVVLDIDDDEQLKQRLRALGYID